MMQERSAAFSIVEMKEIKVVRNGWELKWKSEEETQRNFWSMTKKSRRKF